MELFNMKELIQSQKQEILFLKNKLDSKEVTEMNEVNY